MHDPFDTEGIRGRVLDAWTASPARFREDANAEEDLVRGAYRDRLLVELAQNAADAAVRAGVPGRLRLELSELDGCVLRAANTGAPLDAEGAQALATLRASAKRDDAATVGRFGVGFAAVLAVCDEPIVRSTTGGVRFSADLTRGEVGAVPALAEEVARRDGGVPVLRMPWPADGGPPEGFDTEVLLPLREGTRSAVHAALDALPADLLLALPGLAQIDVVVDGRTRTLRISGQGQRVRTTDDGVSTLWQVAQLSGRLPEHVLADRPVEERVRRDYTVTVAVPLDDDGRPRPLPLRQVVHAPTPSDEPLSLPVRLIAPFPLGPDRRHVAPGPATNALVAVVADAYAGLLTALPADPALLGLVPKVGLAGSELDAALGTAVLDMLRETAWLPVAADAEERQPPDMAVALDDATEERVAALADVLPGLLPASCSRRDDAPALAALGVRRLGVAEAVEAVRGVDRPASWWAALYAALDGTDREELGGLPVPLADGRTAHSPAGVLLPDPDLPVDRLEPLGLRLADPDAVATAAAQRLLERLGARPATPAAVLADPAVQVAVEGSMDAVEDAAADGPAPGDLASAVLALVAAARTAPGELPWLAELALPDAAGGWAPAGELVLPGSPLAGVLEDGALGVLDPAVAAETGPEALRAVGVLDSFALVRAEHPEDLDVDAVEEWMDAVLDRLPADSPPPDWPPVVGVRDLEVVADWPAALRLLADVPAEAWADVVLGGVRAPSYLRWWLSTHPVLEGGRPDRLRSPEADELQGLYEPAAATPALLELLRPPRGVDDVLADVDGALDLLGRLGDPARTVRPDVLRTVYARLAIALDGVDVDPPGQVRVAPDRVSAHAVVLDAPFLQPLVSAPLVPAGGAPGAVADLLDVPLASEVVRGTVRSRPARRMRWSTLPGARLAAARLGLADLEGEVAVHDELLVEERVVRWWPEGGVDHTDGSPEAFGRALAWRAGRWELRQALVEAFGHPDRADELAAEDAV